MDGPATPLLTGSKGIKDKMRWKIDVEGVDIKGDQKMTEVLEKVSILRSRLEARKVKLLKENEMGLSTTTTTPTEEEPEPVSFFHQWIGFRSDFLELLGTFFA